MDMTVELVISNTAQNVSGFTFRLNNAEELVPNQETRGVWLESNTLVVFLNGNRFDNISIQGRPTCTGNCVKGGFSFEIVARSPSVNIPLQNMRTPRDI